MIWLKNYSNLIEPKYVSQSLFSYSSKHAAILTCKYSVLPLSLDDSSAGREGVKPAGETEYSSDLTGKLGKVLQSSDPL